MGKLTFLVVILASAAVIWYMLMMGEASNAAYDMKNPKTPSVGILTGGQPSQGDLVKLKDEGYRTVINMRLPDEFDDFDEAAEVGALGMTYIDLPINVRGDINQTSAKQLDALLKDADGPVFVHCGSGDRVGSLFALRAHHVEGKSVEEAIEIGKTAGLNRLEGIVRGMFDAEEEADH